MSFLSAKFRRAVTWTRNHPVKATFLVASCGVWAAGAHVWANYDAFWGKSIIAASYSGYIPTAISYVPTALEYGLRGIAHAKTLYNSLGSPTLKL